MKILRFNQAHIVSFLLSLVMLSAFGSAPGAYAQGSAPSGVEKVNPAALEEVIVTAQKREQSLQDVPVAVTAITQETLQVNSVINVNDLSGLAPNLTVRPSTGGVNLPIFTMRGIPSYGIVPGSDRQISIYLDGVYLGSPRGGIFTLPDIQRLEVLRGPQGTLFGRNATGGAISVVTRDPAGELGFRQKVGVGNRNYLTSQTTLDTPTWGPLSAYLTYITEEQDGDTDNLGRNTRWDTTAWGLGFRGSPKTLGEVDNQSVFGAASLDFDTFRLTLKYDYGKEQGTPQSNAIVTPICGACITSNPAAGPLIDGLAAVNSDLTGTGKTTRPGKVNNAWTVQRDQTIAGYNLTAAWDVTDSLTLTNILAYRDTKQDSAADITGTSGWIAGPIGPLLPPSFGGPFTPDTPFCYVCSFTTINSDQWSDELQLNYASDFMTLTAGALYYWGKDNVEGHTFQFGFFPDYVIPGPDQDSDTTHNKIKSYAAYAQVEFDLTDTITLLTGLRYTKDDKNGDIYSLAGGQPIEDSSFDYNNDKVSYLLGLQYSPTEEIMVYGKYSTAYVSGGAVGSFGFDPEEAESWELGSKAQFFDNRLRANLALFDVTYKHLQSSQSGRNVPGAGGIPTLIVECCKNDTKGVELELTAVPDEAWLFSASMGYQDTEFSDVNPLVEATVGGSGPNAYPNSSFEPTLVPEWNASLSANYTSPPLFDEAYVNAGVSGLWQDKIRLDSNPARSDPANTPFGVAEFTPSQWTWNARASLTNIRLSDSWTGEVALWGRNLTDNDHITFIVNFGAMEAGSFVQERSYGIDLVVNFE